jgi:hypothetical protein
MKTDNYILIDTNTGETLNDKVYILTDVESVILNYAYSLNCTSKKMVAVELD